MRNFLFIFFILYSFHVVYSQHTYEFNITPKKEHTILKLDTLYEKVKNENKVIFQVIDKETKDAMAFVDVKISQKDSIIKHATTNFDGFVNLVLNNGDYLMKVSYIHYENFEQIITVTSDLNLKYIIEMGCNFHAPEKLVIRSTKELLPTELDEIKSCVLEGKWESCKKKFKSKKVSYYRYVEI